MDEKQDTIKLAREMSQRLIDRFNETKWGCSSVENACCVPTHIECNYCPFDERGEWLPPIHKILPGVQK